MVRLARTLAVLSALFNVVFLGGRPGEMTSTKVYRLARRGVRSAKIAERVLNWFDPEHCRKCFETDIRRAKELLEELQ